MGLQNKVQFRWKHWTIQARLVAKWYSRIKGLDYNETFAPDAKFATIKCLIVVVSIKEWPQSNE